MCGDGTGGGLAEKRTCFGVPADAVRLAGSQLLTVWIGHAVVAAGGQNSRMATTAAGMLRWASRRANSVRWSERRWRSQAIRPPPLRGNFSPGFSMNIVG